MAQELLEGPSVPENRLQLFDPAPDELPSAERIASALRMGRCPSDRLFDRFLPEELRRVSGRYWTPLVVAARAARWFEELGVRTVVDIGSGAGKFCVAAALAGHAHYFGIEQRPRLVAAAQELARIYAVDERVRFAQAAFGVTATPRADAYYLYNPFGENLFGPPDHLDEEVELGDDRYRRDTAAMLRLLRDAPEGTFVLTYNGFGGRVPPSYREVRVDRAMPNVLRMWQKELGGSGEFQSCAP